MLKSHDSRSTCVQERFQLQRWLLPLWLLVLLPSPARALLECPTPIDRIAYRVSPSNPDPIEAAGATGAIIAGLAQWIEARAEAELRLWAMESVIGKICSNRSDQRGYFPATCRLNANLTDADVAQIATSYEVFVRTIRDDIQYSPACALYQFQDSRLPIGYLLQSIYDQHELGVSLEQLFFGLSNHALLNRASTDAQSPRLCRQDGAELTPYCGIVIPILAYASAREANGDYDEFLENLSTRLEREDLRDVVRRIDDASAFFAAFQSEITTIARIEQLLSEKPDVPREEAVRYLLQMTESLSTQFQIAFQLTGLSQADVSSIAEALTEITSVYGSIRSREYVSAMARLISVASSVFPSACAESRDDCATSVQRLERLASSSLTLASLAEAKSADDFADRLDDIAAPVGAYRLRRQGPMIAVSALPGISYGDQVLVAGDDELFSGSSAAAFAPIGVSTTWSSCPAVCGLFVSMLDLGNLMDDSVGTVQIEGITVGGDVDSSFSDVFAPGIYFTYAPRRLGPIVLGFGSSYGPSGRKTGIDQDGSEFGVDREWNWRVFLAVDIVMFPFQTR